MSAAALIAKSLVVCVAVAAAAYLAANGSGAWGWFLLVAVLVA